MDANNKDSCVSTQLGGPLLATFPNLESIFENTCLKDLLTAIDFIWALQTASHDDPHCKMNRDAIERLRNPATTPFDISSRPDLRIGLVSENLLRPLPDILMRAVRLNASREMLSWVFAGKEYKRRAYGIISTRSSKWSCDRTERCKSVTQILTTTVYGADLTADLLPITRMYTSTISVTSCWRIVAPRKPLKLLERC